MSNANVNVNEITNTNVKIVPSAQGILIETLLRNIPSVGGIKFAEIPLSLLTVHPTVQRERRGHEKKIAAQWDKRKAGAILVSYRDGYLYIIDGQHRYWAAQLAGENSIACQVYEGLTEADEAMIFGKQDEIKVRLRTVEKLSALYKGGDSATVTLKEICDKYNIVLLPQDPDERPILRGIRVTITALRLHGREGLEWIFETIRKSGWHMVNGAYSEPMIGALRSVYANHRHDLDRTQERLVKMLKPVTYDMVAAHATVKYVNRTKTLAISSLMESELERNMGVIPVIETTIA